MYDRFEAGRLLSYNKLTHLFAALVRPTNALNGVGWENIGGHFQFARNLLENSKAPLNLLFN